MDDRARARRHDDQPEVPHGRRQGCARYDIVVANPMWNQPFAPDVFANDPFDRFRTAGGITTGKGDWAWLQHTLACLNDRGRAAVVLDTGAVTRGSGSKNEDKERNIRKWFVEHDLIDGVILLPDNLFYNTTAAGVIVVLNKRKPAARKDKIVLLNASRRVKKGRPKNYIPEEDIRPLAAAFLKGEPVEGEVAVITRAAGRGGGLQPQPEPVGGAGGRRRAPVDRGHRRGTAVASTSRRVEIDRIAGEAAGCAMIATRAGVSPHSASCRDRRGQDDVGRSSSWRRRDAVADRTSNVLWRSDRSHAVDEIGDPERQRAHSEAAPAGRSARMRKRRHRLAMPILARRSTACHSTNDLIDFVRTSWTLSRASTSTSCSRVTQLGICEADGATGTIRESVAGIDCRFELPIPTPTSRAAIADALRWSVQALTARRSAARSAAGPQARRDARAVHARAARRGAEGDRDRPVPESWDVVATRRLCRVGTGTPRGRKFADTELADVSLTCECQCPGRTISTTEMQIVDP